MFSKALLKICITTSVLLGASFSFAANAYTLTEKFATKHYALYEVILGKGEVYDSSLKNIIANDVARKVSTRQQPQSLIQDQKVCLAPSQNLC